MALGGGRSQLCSRGRHCGWERAGSAAGAGLTLAERGGVGSRGGWGGVPSCALGGCNCGWERPFRPLLGPQGSPSRGCSGGLRTTGKGTGTAWSREPSIPPSVGTFSELPNLAVAERPRPWCQGLYRSTPLLKNLSLHGFPKQPSVPWKSKGQNTELWPAGPALLLALCKPAGP